MTVSGDALSIYCNSFSIIWADLLEEKVFAVMLKKSFASKALIFFFPLNLVLLKRRLRNLPS